MTGKVIKIHGVELEYDKAGGQYLVDEGDYIKLLDTLGSGEYAGALFYHGVPIEIRE